MERHTNSKSVFAIRSEDALSWHDVTKELAGIAQRCGFNIRPKRGWNIWQVWATQYELANLTAQVIQ